MHPYKIACYQNLNFVEHFLPSSCITFMYKVCSDRSTYMYLRY